MDPTGTFKGTAPNDDVFVVRVRRESTGKRTRISVTHVGSGRSLSSEDLKDVDDFIRLTVREEEG